MDHQVGIHHLLGRNTDLAGLLGSKGGLGEAWSHVCPPPAGSRVGVGCGQKPHQAHVSSLGQKGQEERRATGKGEGWRKDGELRPKASERRDWWTALLSLSLHTQHSAMAWGRGTALAGSQR